MAATGIWYSSVCPRTLDLGDDGARLRLARLPRLSQDTQRFGVSRRAALTTPAGDRHSIALPASAVEAAPFFQPSSAVCGGCLRPTWFGRCRTVVCVISFSFGAPWRYACAGCSSRAERLSRSYRAMRSSRRHHRRDGLGRERLAALVEMALREADLRNLGRAGVRRSVEPCILREIGRRTTNIHEGLV